MSSRGVLAALLFTVVGLGCGSKDGPGASASASAATSKGKVIQAADNEDVASATSTARAAETPVIQIPAGKFEAGSTPGDRGRNAIVEPGLLSIDLGAYDIDRSPYPNEPGKAPLTGVTRDRAQELCKAKNRRLCSELEWEHACKGPEGDAFAGAHAWDPSCAKGTCASGFGVQAMGSLREIVTGEIVGVKDLADGGPVVRGADGASPPPEHRCAKRTKVEAALATDNLGFRCCGGAENAATIPAPITKQTFERVELPASKAAELFSTVPQLAKLGSDLKYFDEAGAKQVIALSDAGDVPKGITLTTSPLHWSPVPGEDLLILVGQAGDDSFIVAFYMLPDDCYRIGSTMVLHKEKGPVVLGFNGYDGKRQKDKSNATLDWGTCWKCSGESGFVTYKEDGRVTITQE